MDRYIIHTEIRYGTRMWTVWDLSKDRQCGGWLRCKWRALDVLETCYAQASA